MHVHMWITYTPLNSLIQTLQWPILSKLYNILTDFIIIFLTIYPNPPCQLSL